MLDRLLQELPPRVRAVVDTAVFASLGEETRCELDCLAEEIGAHLVVYDLRVEAEGLALSAAVGQAYLSPGQLARLRRAELELAPGSALVAYEQPARLRLPAEVLARAAAAIAARA